jgi:hypothetical protein
MTAKRLLYVAAPLLALGFAASACGGGARTAAPATTVPVAAPATTVAPTTATTVAPTTVAPTTTAPKTKTVYVPVPVYEPPAASYTPPSQAPVDLSVWQYAPPASYILNSVYVHTTADLTSSHVDQVFVGQNLGVICSVQGQEVTEYGDSSQWDYVQSPNDIYGWVADEFINVDGPAVPAC